MVVLSMWKSAKTRVVVPAETKDIQEAADALMAISNREVKDVLVETQILVEEETDVALGIPDQDVPIQVNLQVRTEKTDVPRVIISL